MSSIVLYLQMTMEHCEVKVINFLCFFQSLADLVFDYGILSDKSDKFLVFLSEFGRFNV